MVPVSGKVFVLKLQCGVCPAVSGAAYAPGLNVLGSVAEYRDCAVLGIHAAVPLTRYE